MAGRTPVPGLFAVGRPPRPACTAPTGLASNSLTEALITGRRAGELLGYELPGPAGSLRLPPPAQGDAAVRPALAAAMSRHAGVLRDRDGMQDLQRTLDQAPPMGGRQGAAHPSRTSPHAMKPPPSGWT